MTGSYRRTTALALLVLVVVSACESDGPALSRRAPAPEPVHGKQRVEPDDVLVAFRRRCFDPSECDTSRNGIFGVHHRKRGHVRLTADPSDRDPAWSRDGRRLAFARCDRDDCDLWVLNLDEMKERRVTRGPHVDSDPSWSRDGTALVLQRCDPGELAGNSCELWITAVGGGAERVTRNDVADGNPDWSWKVDRIVFDRGDCRSGTTSCRRSSVLVIRPDGTGERVIARRTRGAWGPQWDQTRRRIVYDVCHGVCVRGDRKPGSPLVVLHLRRGSTVVRSRYESAFDPSFSPGGRRLVYGLRSGDEGTITYAPIAGGRERSLYGDYYYEGSSPDWRPRP